MIENNLGGKPFIIPACPSWGFRRRGERGLKPRAGLRVLLTFSAQRRIISLTPRRGKDPERLETARKKKHEGSYFKRRILLGLEDTTREGGDIMVDIIKRGMRCRCKRSAALPIP